MGLIFYSILDKEQFVLKGNYTVNNGITVGSKPIILQGRTKINYLTRERLGTLL